jgi:acyl-CoA thioesterase FadM
MLDKYAELSDINDLDHVLVSLNMNFSGKIFWPGEVEITGFVSEVGSKSVKTEFYVTDKDGTDLADAECVNVFFITYSGKSIIIPEEFKSLLLSGKISA